jgi:hypothetical protein
LVDIRKRLIKNTVRDYEKDLHGSKSIYHPKCGG